MTVRDREVLELLREKPELLAIADAVFESERLPRRSFRIRRTMAAIAVAAAALFVFALISPWQRDDGRGVVLERALAALDANGPVLHVVSEASEGMRVELRTGKVTRRKVILEAWYDQGRRIFRGVSRRDGRVASDQTMLLRPEDKGLAFGLINPFVDAAELYREALRSGKAQVVGTGEWRGKAVYWLEFDDPAPDGLRMGIDRRTYQPLVMKVLSADGNETRFEVGLLRLEYVSRSEAHFGKVIESDFAETLTASGGGLTSGGTVSVTEARNALGVPGVWAGPSVGGIQLNEIVLETTVLKRRNSPELKAKQLHLVYGDRAAFPPQGRRVDVTQMAATQGSAWELIHDLPPPPKGFADLKTSEIHSGRTPRLVATRWVATLAVGKVWAAVNAPSRELAVAAARALRPIPANAR